MRKIAVVLIVVLAAVHAFGENNEGWGNNLQAVKLKYGDMQNVTSNYSGEYPSGVTIYEQINKTFYIYFFFINDRLFRYTMTYGEVSTSFASTQFDILSQQYGQFSAPRQATSFGFLAWDGNSYKYQNKQDKNTTIIFEQIPIGHPGSSRYILQIHFLNPEMELGAVGRENSIDDDIHAEVIAQQRQQEKEAQEAAEELERNRPKGFDNWINPDINGRLFLGYVYTPDIPFGLLFGISGKRIGAYFTVSWNTPEEVPGINNSSNPIETRESRLTDVLFGAYIRTINNFFIDFGFGVYYNSVHGLFKVKGRGEPVWCKMDDDGEGVGFVVQAGLLYSFAPLYVSAGYRQYFNKGYTLAFGDHAPSFYIGGGFCIPDIFKK